MLLSPYGSSVPFPCFCVKFYLNFATEYITDACLRSSHPLYHCLGCKHLIVTSILKKVSIQSWNRTGKHGYSLFLSFGGNAHWCEICQVGSGACLDGRRESHACRDHNCSCFCSWNVNTEWSVQNPRCLCRWLCEVMLHQNQQTISLHCPIWAFVIALSVFFSMRLCTG